MPPDNHLRASLEATSPTMTTKTSSTTLVALVADPIDRRASSGAGLSVGCLGNAAGGGGGGGGGGEAAATHQRHGRGVVGGRGGGRKRYDPIARHSNLEAELFRLKFERARAIEEYQVRELRDRKNASEIARLREHLCALEVELGGVVAKGDGEEGAHISDGLRRRRDKLETSDAILQRDAEGMRAELESERAKAAEASELLGRRESDRNSVESRHGDLEAKGERLASEQVALQSRCTAHAVAVAELRDGRKRAEGETVALAEKVARLRDEMYRLDARMSDARHYAKEFRRDATMSRRHSARLMDQLLAAQDPEEYRRRRQERSERRKREKAEDAAWAESVREEREREKEKERAATAWGGARLIHHVQGSLRFLFAGEERGSSVAGEVVIPRETLTSSRRSMTGTNRRYTDARRSSSRSAGLALSDTGGRLIANDCPHNRDIYFRPKSWRKDRGNDGESSVVSGLTAYMTSRRGVLHALFGQDM